MPLPPPAVARLDACVSLCLAENRLPTLADAAAFGVPYDAAASLRRSLVTRLAKARAPELRAAAAALQARWAAGAPLSLLAAELRHPPCLVARAVIERLLAPRAAAAAGGRKEVGRWLRAPGAAAAAAEAGGALAPEVAARLAADVAACVAADSDYAPAADNAKRAVGAEYEHLLYNQLRARGVPFQDEDTLRERGLPKTPDVLLRSPMRFLDPARHGVKERWRTVHWIDSKAMYGDGHTWDHDHAAQLLGYVNRFGPGMVVYWLDFDAELRQRHDALFVVAALPRVARAPGDG